MFNLTFILTYIQSGPPITTHNLPRDHSAAVSKDPSSKYVMIFLMSITFMLVHYASEHRQLRRQHQRQQKKLADLEVGLKDLRGRILPKTGCPLLDDDDDFKLPSPAYELDECIREVHFISVVGSILPAPGCPQLDDDDDFRLPSPAYELDECILHDRERRIG